MPVRAPQATSPDVLFRTAAERGCRGDSSGYTTLLHSLLPNSSPDNVEPEGLPASF